MAEQCYHDGDFWQCIIAADVNESPTAAPTKWARLKIPVAWRRVLARFTYAHLLELDGQGDKALVARAQAREELETLTRYQANREGWRPRTAVQTR